MLNESTVTILVALSTLLITMFSALVVMYTATSFKKQHIDIAKYLLVIVVLVGQFIVIVFGLKESLSFFSFDFLEFIKEKNILAIVSGVLTLITTVIVFAVAWLKHSSFKLKENKSLDFFHNEK